jgi:hypothetical protein
VTILQPTQVTSCCNPPASVRLLSANSRSARMPFPQLLRVFTVERSLASSSYLTGQNIFRGTSLNSPLPNKSKISRLVDRFCHRETHPPGCIIRQEEGECMQGPTPLTLPLISIISYFVSWSQHNLFFDKCNVCREWVAWLFYLVCMLLN